MEIKDQTFSGETVATDGKKFVGCTFSDVTLQYGGGVHPVFDDCRFEGVSWRFADAATRTIQFLQRINASPDGPAFIADLFQPGKYITD